MSRGGFAYVDLYSAKGVMAFPLEAVIHTERTIFQTVQILEGPRGRTLMLDGIHQSSEADEWCYHEMLVHPAMQFHTRHPGRVLILGGGEGATAREVLRYPDVKQVAMIELDARLVAVCNEYMPELSCGAFSDHRLNLHIRDATHWLEEDRSQYDVVVSDVLEPDSSSLSDQLYGIGGIRQIERRLAPHGVLAVHCGAIHTAHVDGILRVVPVLRRVFEHVRVGICPELRWSFAVASHSPLDTTAQHRPIPAGTRYYSTELHRAYGALPAYVIRALEAL
jgi:spermidine synthase